MTKYPIIIVVGDFGSGKTLYTTFMGLTFYQNEGLKIFSNYDLFKVPYKKIKFSDVSSMPDWLHDGVLLLDETQIGADSYNFLNKGVQQIMTFITQIRKRNIVLIMTTQRFDFVAKRIRSLINYFIEVEAVSKGVVKISTYDITRGEELQNERTLDLTKIWSYYNTDEVITNE
jgi:hypothetical protein